jgi:hypothetical protein
MICPGNTRPLNGLVDPAQRTKIDNDASGPRSQRNTRYYRRGVLGYFDGWPTVPSVRNAAWYSSHLRSRALA